MSVTKDSLEIFDAIAGAGPEKKAGPGAATSSPPEAPPGPIAESPRPPRRQIVPAPQAEAARGRGRPRLADTDRTNRKTVSVRLEPVERMQLSTMMGRVRTMHFERTGEVLEDEISPFVRIGIQLVAHIGEEKLYEAFLRDREGGGK